MLSFILRRILEAIPTLLVLITISFFLIRFAPGSPFTTERKMPPEVLANIEAKYGFDKPLHEQYWSYLSGLARGDLGPSFVYKDYSVSELVGKAFPVSLKIGLTVFVVSVVLGVILGILAALYQNTWADYTIMSFSVAGIVIPTYVIAPLLVLLFAIHLKWLPAGGWNDGGWQYMLLPVVAMAKGFTGYIARIMRGSMIEVLHQDFIRTARAKGLPTHTIMLRHALRPAMLPLASVLGPAMVGIITGSVVIENIFGIPGMGQLFVNGALNRDYSMVLGLTVLVGALTIAFNAIVDIAYAYIDPKIRYA